MEKYHVSDKINSSTDKELEIYFYPKYVQFEMSKNSKYEYDIIELALNKKDIIDLMSKLNSWLASYDVE